MGNSYLSSQIMVVQQQGESFLIKEGGYPAFTQANLLTKTAYAYTECIAADGGQIMENGINGDSEEDPINYITVIDGSNLLAVNSPAEFLLPAARRNSIINYLVKEGDSPGKIAANFDISLNTVLWANNLNFNSVIKPGQELIILPVSGVIHKVKKGESLSIIASKYKASIDEIINFNDLKDEGSIQIGQELIIPGGVLAAANSSTSQKSSSSGLKPMTEDVSLWPNYKDFFAYPVSGGWNKGILHYYNAVDIINSCGSPVYAAADGIITEAKGAGAYNLGYGNMVKIQHYNATITVYAHLNEVSVAEGDKVYKGDLIGRMGDTGNSNGCHLHFEVRGAQNPFVK